MCDLLFSVWAVPLVKDCWNFGFGCVAVDKEQAWQVFRVFWRWKRLEQLHGHRAHRYTMLTSIFQVNQFARLWLLQFFGILGDGTGRLGCARDKLAFVVRIVVGRLKRELNGDHRKFERRGPRGKASAKHLFSFYKKNQETAET